MRAPKVSAVHWVPEPVDMTRTFFLMCISSSGDEPTIFSEAGLSKWRAWKAAVMGRLIFEAVDSVSEEKSRASTDGGPLTVVDESDSALI